MSYLHCVGLLLKVCTTLVESIGKLRNGTIQLIELRLKDTWLVEELSQVIQM